MRELGHGSMITESGVTFPVQPWSGCQFSMNLMAFEAYFMICILFLYDIH